MVSVYSTLHYIDFKYSSVLKMTEVSIPGYFSNSRRVYQRVGYNQRITMAFFISVYRCLIPFNSIGGTTKFCCLQIHECQDLRSSGFSFAVTDTKEDSENLS